MMMARATLAAMMEAATMVRAMLVAMTARPMMAAAPTPVIQATAVIRVIPAMPIRECRLYKSQITMRARVCAGSLCFWPKCLFCGIKVRLTMNDPEGVGECSHGWSPPKADGTRGGWMIDNRPERGGGEE